MTANDDTENTWGVIFDVDGVLIDSYRAHLSAWQRMLKNHGLEMTEEQFASTFGRTNADIFAQLFPIIDPESYLGLADEKEAAFREIIAADFPEMDGAADLVAALQKAGALLAVGSSGPPENVRAVLSAFPGGAHFKAASSSGDIRRGKPDPEVFLKAAAKLGLPPDRCVVVEDAPAGVKAGKAAGCTVIALTGTVSPEQLAEADLIVDSLRRLSSAVFKDMIRKNKGGRFQA